jgi:hypothetical protein
VPLSLSLVLAGAALAQDPTYDKTAAEEIQAAKPEHDLAAELGFLFSAGNTWVVTVNAGVNYAYRWKSNQFRVLGGTVLNLARADTDGDGTVNDETVDEDGDGAADGPAPLAFTSQRAFGGLRYDRFFGADDALYVSGGGEHDRFAGVYWRFNQQVGYRRQLVKNARTAADLEAGLAYAEENLVESTDAGGNPINTAELDAHYLAVRVFLGVTHAFNDVVSISNALEAIEPLLAFRDPNAGGEEGKLTNFEDFRFVNTFGLNLKATDKLQVRLSDRLAFDNQPTGAEYAKVDNTVAITLVASFL